ncbi:uncharacterized protein with FMN-binding domain [Nakamurella sp. UYEF19]|uniref:FMN-binding protein n=1 Tax=Nakamurella sp. UYEF19 TaxID=1756392 RepID=UPI0033932987
MKRIVMFLMGTITVVVLLFGYHTSTSSKAAGGETAFVSTLQAGVATTSTSAVPDTTGQGKPTTASTTASVTSAPATPTTTSPTTATTTAANSTVTGTVADTRWGPVQVQLSVQGGKITSVSVIQYPNGNGRDEEINAQALPILIQETISAQSAQIDMVSGATVTSDGYVTSLQSALDQAGL